MAVTEAWTETALREQDQLHTAFPRSEEFAEFVLGRSGAAFDRIDTGLVEEALDDPTLEPASIDAWELQAACRTVSDAGSLFFSEELADIVAAKATCAGCPVIAPCLEGALARAEPCGVWGGQLFLNGRVLAQKRRRGRPPKVARPEDQLPAVPIPIHLQELVAAAGQ